MSDWDAQQYLKFEDQRSRPARDLAAQIPLKEARRIYDLGCGPGNSTEILRERFPAAEITGLDSSPDMLAKACVRLPGVAFIEGNLETWSPPAGVDVLYSNATFQWVPDHLGVLERLLNALPQGGLLAVQMPDNTQEPSHLAVDEVAADPRWSGALGLAAGARSALLPVAAYYDRLRPLCRYFDIWHTHYEHPLEGAQGIVEWFKGSHLRPYLDALAPAQRAEFLAAYTARIEKAYPKQFDGKCLLRFPRLFIMAGR